MYNGGKILIGLIIFVGLVTFPFLYGGVRATAKPDPKIDTPEILKMPEKRENALNQRRI